VYLSVPAIPASATGPSAPSTRLEVGGTVYEAVEVVRVSPRSLTIRHKHGLGQVMLQELPPAWQRAYGYDPEAEAAYAREVERERQARLSATTDGRHRPAAGHPRPEDTGAGAILANLGTEPKLYREVDFRPVYRELELTTRDQGARPSCSVFAVVAALEFQNAQVRGRPEQLSEEYLVWATARSLGIGPEDAEASDQPLESGFALLEVVQALRAFGIPLQEEMPNTFGKSLAETRAPPEAVIARARARQRIAAYALPGRDGEARVDAVLHTLNGGAPVVVGMAFPHPRALGETHILDGQDPYENYAHAVTLVGYRCESGRKEDCQFIFKNSWGMRWGVGGYGFVSYRYLEEHLMMGILLEVIPD
jgi:hypothetical protein